MDSPHAGQRRSGDFIDMDDPYQVTQWSEIFNISSQDLKDAVANVGTSMTDVRAYVKSRKKSLGS